MKQRDERSRRCFLKSSSMLGLTVAFNPAAIGEAAADAVGLLPGQLAAAQDSSPTRQPAGPGSVSDGHWVAEEAPEKLLAALTPFLAPYRAAAR